MVEIRDALIITVLGISVVFIGLMLTKLMINSFSLLPKISALFEKLRGKKNTAEVQASSQATAAVPPVLKPVGPVTPEILAAITAVLEVEFRLRLSLTEGKFTFKH